MVKPNARLVVVMGIFALICIPVGGLAGYWSYANQLPVYPTPSVVMPVPNAYDDYVAAGQMSYAAGGATVSAAPERPGTAPQQAGGATAAGVPGSPPGGPGAVSGNGGQKQAFEPDMPLAQVQAVVARNRAALARLRRGFRKKYRSPPVVSFNQLIPELAQFRRLAQVLVTEGKLAEREGRPDDAARSYLDCLRLGTDVPRGGAMIHGLVGIAIQRIGLRPLQEAADRLDGPTAAAAAREMVRLDARAPPAAETLANEKEATTASLLELFRRPDARRQLADSCLPDIYVPWISITPKRQMLDNIRGYMDMLIAGSRRPYYARPAPPPIPNDPLSRILLPVFDEAPKWDVRDAQWRITELRLATRAYEQQHGTPPPSLEALVPAYLPAVPQDPFAPKPLVYRRTGAAALIYSRGPDGKDDGGKDLGTWVAPSSIGDIVTMKSLNQH